LAAGLSDALAARLIFRDIFSRHAGRAGKCGGEMRSIISRNAPSRRRSRRYRRAAWRGRRPTRGRRRRNFNSRALNNAYQNPSSRVPESFQRRARRFVRAPLTRPPLLALFLLLFSPPSRPPSLSSPLLSSRYRQFLSRTEGTVLASIIPTSILPWPRWKNLASGLSLSLSLSLPRRRTKPPPALALLRTPASPSPLHLFLFPRPFLLLLLFPAPSPGCDPFRTRSANLPALLAASKRERERERERDPIFTLRQKQKPRGSNQYEATVEFIAVAGACGRARGERFSKLRITSLGRRGVSGRPRGDFSAKVKR